MASGFVFEALKMHLKARGMTYADVAKALKISEATVKRIFASKNCTLERLDEICQLVQVDLAELARGMELAAMSGQIGVVGEVVNSLGMDALSTFLDDMSLRLKGFAVTDLSRARGTREPVADRERAHPRRAGSCRVGDVRGHRIGSGGVRAACGASAAD